MKKVLAFLLVAVMCASLAACGQQKGDAGKKEESSAPETEKQKESEPSKEEKQPESSEASKGGEEKTYKIAISLPPSNPFQAVLLDKLQEKFEADPGIEATIKSSTDVADQMNVLQAFKDDKSYDMIVALPEDPLLLTTVIDEIYDTGVPVVVIDRDTTSDKKTAFVSCDSYGGGAVVAKYAQEFFKDYDKVNYVVLRCYAGSPMDLDRYNGFHDIISKDPKFVNLGEADTEFDYNKAYEEMSNLLSANEKIDFVYSEDDGIATGAITAIDQFGRKDIVLINGFGGTTTGMERIKADNTIHKLTAAYLPGDIAQATYDVVSKYLRGGTCEPRNIIEAYAITKDNVDEAMDKGYEG